jgi:hypothetical protein
VPNVPIGNGGRIWEMLKNLESTPWKQLGEFIDNSISSSMSGEDPDRPVQIDINFDPDYGHGEKKGRIVIRDNALGISEKMMQRAFDLGNIPEDLLNPKNLNQFGVGMKVAACWFGDKWTVETSAIDEPFKKTVLWDLKKVIAGKLTELPVVTVPAKRSEHFTVITITDLNHSPDHQRTIAKIKTFIPKMFRKFIEQGNVTITWNGEVLVDKTEGVLIAPWYKDVENEVKNAKQITWETDFKVNLNSKYKISGYACLFKKFDKQHTGLNYFWRNRLIQGNVEPFYRPTRLFNRGNSFKTGRLYIEVYCDDLKVTNNKGAIDWGLSKVREDDLIEALYDQLRLAKMPLLQQGENHRNPEPEISKTRIDTGLDFAEDVANEHGKTFIESDIPPTQDVHFSSAEVDMKIYSDRVITHMLDGHETTFRVACVAAGPRTPWVSIEWGNGINPEHSVLLNLNHPFVQKHLTNATLPIFIGLGVSLLYGEYKSSALLKLDELRILRQFTDKFMRYMAVAPGIGDEDDTED